MKPRAVLLLAIVFGAAALRLLPHPSNFTPIGALALFAGAHFDDKRWAFIVPLAAMFLSDILIGFHGQMPVVYAAFAVIVCMGFVLREKKTALRVTGASLAAATFFFIVFGRTDAGFRLRDGAPFPAHSPHRRPGARSGAPARDAFGTRRLDEGVAKGGVSCR